MSNERKSLLISKTKNSNYYNSIKTPIPLTTLKNYNCERNLMNNQQDKNDEENGK